MALTIVTQPQSVLVPQNQTSVTFTVSGLDGAKAVTYQWRRQDTGGASGYVNIAGATSNSLTLAPIANYDNDTFVALVSSTSVGQALSSDIVTFGIRLSADIYSPWETPTETGANRVRRLQNLGYL